MPKIKEPMLVIASLILLSIFWFVSTDLTVVPTPVPPPIPSTPTPTPSPTATPTPYVVPNSILCFKDPALKQEVFYCYYREKHTKVMLTYDLMRNPNGIKNASILIVGRNVWVPFSKKGAKALVTGGVVTIIRFAVEKKSHWIIVYRNGGGIQNDMQYWDEPTFNAQFKDGQKNILVKIRNGIMEPILITP